MHSHAAPSATAVDATALLRDAGLRVTKPRTAVIGALADSPHASADGGSKGEITCLGIMVSATMTSLDDPFDEGGYLLPATKAIDAGGTDISAIQTIGCPSSPYLDAGWTPVAGASFPRDGIGTPVDQVLLGVVGVPVGEVGDAQAITFRTLTGEAALEFAVTETL